MNAVETMSPVRTCTRVCPHIGRLRVLIAQVAHLNHQVARVARGLSSRELTPDLASAILTRSMHETAAMGVVKP